MEIERKFIIKNVPEQIFNFPCKKISQGYISTDPVIRIRQMDTQYFLTCKGQGLISREEFELEITESQFTHLSTKLDTTLLEKTRYFIPIQGNLTIELDFFSGNLSGLIIAEVEFSSIEEAEIFEAPEWFLMDVSQISQFHNSHLCRVTSLEDLNIDLWLQF